MVPEYVPGLVSVIIPLYNRSTFIEQTIRSVTQQSYTNWELIVVDDGSDDGSYELVKQLSDNIPLTLLHHTGHQNLGQSASLNLGLSQCRGEFIAILDSDDLFERDKLAHQVAELQLHPDCGLVYGLGVAIDAEGNTLYPILDDTHTESNDPNAVLLDCYFLLPQNSLVRRVVYLRTGGFDESLRAAQDHDMLIRMAEVCDFRFCPTQVFRYRRHQNSISTKHQVRRWESGFVILDKARKRFPYRHKTLRKRLAVLHFRLGRALIDEQSISRGLFHLIAAGLLDPVRAIKVLFKFESVQ